MRMLGKLLAHLLHRSATLDEHLVGHAQFLGDGQHLVVVVVALVYVHRDTILTHLQRLPQRGDLQACNLAAFLRHLAIAASKIFFGSDAYNNLFTNLLSNFSLFLLLLNNFLKLCPL